MARRHEAVDVDRRFFEALLAADAHLLDELLHPEFVIVDVGSGSVTPRRELVELVDEGRVRFDRIDVLDEDAIVREVGGAALVVGATRMQVSMPDGSQLETLSRYTHVFVQEPAGSGWSLVSAQGTPIRG